MKLLKITLFLISCASLNAGERIIKGQPKISGPMAQFLEETKPSFQRCRPAIQASHLNSIVENRDTLVDSTLGAIACMIDGWKKLYVLSLTDFRFDGKDVLHRITDFGDDLEYFLFQPSPMYHVWRNPENNKFEFRATKSVRKPSVLIFPSHNKKQAIQFALWESTQDKQNFYLQGMLLSYPEVDIAAFYDQPFYKDLVKFDVDKQAALKWFTENNDDKELYNWLQSRVENKLIQHGVLKDFPIEVPTPPAEPTGADATT